MPTIQLSKRTNLNCIILTSSHKIDCIWDEGVKGTEVIGERKTNSQLEHGVASFFFFPHWGRRAREETSERDGEEGGARNIWGPLATEEVPSCRSLPAAPSTFAVPKSGPWERLCGGGSSVMTPLGTTMPSIPRCFYEEWICRILSPVRVRVSSHIDDMSIWQTDACQ